MSHRRRQIRHGLGTALCHDATPAPVSVTVTLCQHSDSPRSNNTIGP